MPRGSLPSNPFVGQRCIFLSQVGSVVVTCPAGPSRRRLGVLLHAGSGQMEKTKLELDRP